MKDIKIIYLTNDSRRYAGMKNACLALQDEGRISDFCMAVKLEGSSEWDRFWEKKFSGASLVVARFFRNISKSAFWESCRDFLAARNIPYLLDAVEGKDAQDAKGAGVKPDVASRLKGYTFYGGAENDVHQSCESSADDEPEPAQRHGYTARKCGKHGLNKSERGTDKNRTLSLC